jgi:hypothetical protein
LVLGLLQGSFKAPFVYNSKWACGNNHMLSHPMRAMLASYAIRGPLWSYIHLCQGSFKAHSRHFKDSSSGHTITALEASSIYFEIDLSSWLDYLRLASQGFINMYSRPLLLASWLQGFLNWLHGFKDFSRGFMDSILKQSQGLFTWFDGLKVYLLGFMDSRLLHLDLWLQYSNNIPFSLPHHHHHCYILIITSTSSSSLPL